MSKSLGPVQREALALLDGNRRGLTVPALAYKLGVDPRRGRKIVASLAVRGEVAVSSASGERRVVLPGLLSAHIDYEGVRRLFLADLAAFNTPKWAAKKCPCCGEDFK